MNKQLGTIFAIVFIDLLGFGIILPLLPYIAEKFAASPVEIGLLTATYSLFQFISGPILGSLSDRYGRKLLLIFSQLGSMLGYLLLGFAGSLPLLFLSRVIDGITGGNISIAQAYIADITDKNTRVKGMGILGAAFGLGFMLGPAIGGYLSRFGYGAPAFFAAAVAAITSLATAIFLKETLDIKKPEKSTKTSLAWKNLKHIISAHPIGALIISYFFISLGFSLMQGTYALYVQRVLGWGPQQVGNIFALVGIVSIITQLYFIKLVLRKFGQKKTLLLSLPIMALGIALIGFAQTMGLMLIANSFIPLGNGLASPTISALASENINKKEYGSTLGLLQSSASLGRIMGPIIGGELFSSFSPSAPYFTAGVVLIGVFFFLSRELSKIKDF